MANKPSRWRTFLSEMRVLLDESAPLHGIGLTKLHRFAHFWFLVARSFSRNRCPVRASALAYASLLALIPMLAVVVSVTSSFLKKEGEQQIDEFIVRMVDSLTPSASMHPKPDGESTGTNAVAAESQSSLAESAGTNQPAAGVGPAGGTNLASATKLSQADQVVRARKEIARTIHSSIQSTRSGTLGLTGTVLLIFVAISMLTRIEDTFNDVWGVARGRTWFTRIVVYWGVISLAPMLLVVALGLASGPHLEGTKRLLTETPFLGHLIFQILPVLVLCLGFTIFYVLMPNTKVQWGAAAVGGVIGGLLFHLNNVISVLYVSRVVSNSKIYGGLGLVPVLMIGLYFSWLILLFGAQVAYAYQNRTSYLEEKQVEHVNQRGREFIALRLMTAIGQRYHRGEPPISLVQVACELTVPTRLARQVLQTLSAARLVVETAGAESAYLPARPLVAITCHDILMAMRAAQGQELMARDEPACTQVIGEFHRIEEAERAASSSVTMLDLVNRVQTKQIGN
jgi:membrane protein